MNIAITGGGGYVGSTLVPYLLKKGHHITVLDTFWFGDFLPAHQNLRKLKGDIRKPLDVWEAFKNQEAAIHLACVSNDPSFDMNPRLGREINYDSFQTIIAQAEHCGVEHFIYASSSSVYGVSDLQEVHEDAPKNPLTDYSKYKLWCERDLEKVNPAMKWTIIRPATVCGFSERLRLDLVVNILTTQALVKNKITVFGGHQKRPNIHILDMARAYECILENRYIAHKKIYNVGFENHNLRELAHMVQEVVGRVKVEFEPTKDDRSYHVSSNLIKDHLGFEPNYSILQAIGSIKAAMESGQIRDALNNTLYYNIKRMKELGLT